MRLDSGLSSRRLGIYFRLFEAEDTGVPDEINITKELRTVVLNRSEILNRSSVFNTWSRPDDE